VKLRQKLVFAMNQIGEDIGVHGQGAGVKDWG
jgi:hypothetical protein